MKADSTTCPESLESFLADNLPHDAATAVEQHLAECRSCQRRLEDLAAPGDAWSTARASLTEDTCSVFNQLNQQEPDHSSVADAGQVEIFLTSFLASSDDPAMCGRLAGYEIAGVIGIGAMGIVLKAFERTLDRFVAIKVLSPAMAGHATARQRFSREARAAAAIVHPNVIAIHRIDEWNGLPFLVMPYVTGGSLQDYVERHGPLPVASVLQIGCQMASGLAAAHRQGLVHRDIKPSNVLLDQGIERLLISDFGLALAADDASLTNSGVIAGTPLYMSPEQARGESIDFRSDLFSLGSVLYTMCTGRAAFRAETAYGVLRRITDDQPRDIREINPDIPDWLNKAIQTLQQKDPHLRFDSAETAARVFEDCLAHLRQPKTHHLPDFLLNNRSLTNGLFRRIRQPTVIAAVALTVLSLLLFSFINRDRLSLPPGDTASAIVSVTESQPPEAISETAGLTYRFSQHQPLTYLVTMSVSQPDVETQIEGLMTIDSRLLHDEQYRLSIGYQLQLSETLRQAPRHSAGVTITPNPSRRRQRWNAPESEQLTVAANGTILSVDQTFAVPWLEKSFTEFLIVPLSTLAPAEHSSVGDNRQLPPKHQQHHLILLEAGSTVSQNRSLQMEFDTESGSPASVRAEIVVVQETDFVQQRTPVHLQLVRLTEDEQAAWNSATQQGQTAPQPKLEPMSPEMESEMLSDFSNNRRVLHWLHELDRHPVTTFSPNIVDALAIMADHEQPTIKTLAGRLIERIPDNQLNPFREVE